MAPAHITRILRFLLACPDRVFNAALGMHLARRRRLSPKCRMNPHQSRTESFRVRRAHTPFAASCRPFLANDGFSARAALLGATCVNYNRTFLRTASDARVHSLTLCVASHFVMLALLCRCSVGIEFFWRVELADEHGRER